MIKYESQCVSCDLYCLRENCPNFRVEIHYCDKCREEADYILDGEDYCEDCAEEYLTNFFKELSLKEKAELLDIKLESLQD